MATKPLTIRFPLDLEEEVKSVLEFEKYKMLDVNFTQYVLMAIREQIKKDKKEKGV